MLVLKWNHYFIQRWQEQKRCCDYDWNPSNDYLWPELTASSHGPKKILPSLAISTKFPNNCRDFSAAPFPLCKQGSLVWWVFDILTKLSFGKFFRMTRIERWKGGGREWWITDSLLSNRRRQEPLASYAMSYPGTEHQGEEGGGWRGFSSDPQCAPLMMSWSRIHLLIISQPTRQ